MSNPPDGQVPGFAALLAARFTDDADLTDGLRKVAAAAGTLLVNCAGASVTIIERGKPSTAASTDDDTLALDNVQYDAGDGPCLTAARDQHVIRIDAMDTDTRWPAFTAAARARGIGSSLSMPLDLAGETVGGLNVYGQEPDAFSTQDEQLAKGFAVQASVVISNAQAYWAAFELIRNLTIAMDSRAVIEKAKGILIARHGLSDDEAFDHLRQQSQTENRKLRDIATDIVDQARDAARP